MIVEICCDIYTLIFWVSSLPEVETGQQGVTLSSILLHPSSETFPQSFSLDFLLALGPVPSPGSQLNTGPGGLPSGIIPPSDEGWSDGHILGLHLPSPGGDDIEHGGLAGHHSHQAGQAGQD